ncbi:serine/threonine-protein kinase [Actinomadura chibensis]|uniref:serine/threonine-protein kinase n=1 Tax=Actinomadura chibensis TaxID=392828 RepID=UPI000829E610|nr:serine/threonine-protein kinase [Actinomadura chibensis]
MQGPLRDRDPRRLGPYRLTARLGRGGMGTVFLGADGAGRQVAVKVINAELADDEAFHERFRREVTAARQVRPFCTAAVLDAQLDGEPLYVVTEYVAGPSLEEAVKAGGPLRGGDLESFAVNIATALSAIHGAGIVHRDLKPANVLLSSTGPRVIDFGIARALDSADGPTRTGQFVGTPAYMAPELMHGREVTPAADVFSWGCVVAYAGTGRVPFGGGTLPEIINRVTNADPDLRGLDPAVRDVVARSLAKDPAARPPVKQLISALTGEDETPATLAMPEAPPPAAPPPAAPFATPPAVEPTLPGGGVPGTRAASASAPARLARSPQRLGLLAVTVAAAVVLSVMAFTADRKSSGDGAAGAAEGARAPSSSALSLGKPPKRDEKVFEDDFDDAGSGWRKAADARYADRAYVLTGETAAGGTAAGGAVADAPVPVVPRSQLIEVKIESIGADGEAGVFCHGRRGFAFLLSASGHARIAAFGSTGTLTDIAANPAVEVRDKRNRVQVACVVQDGHLSLGMWVNGKAAVDATRPLPADSGMPGPSGLLVSRPDGASGRPEAEFDDFSLCSV